VIHNPWDLRKLMGGRLTATFEFSDIRLRWNLDRDLPLYTPRFNIAPEQIASANIPVIIRGGEKGSGVINAIF